MGDRLNLTDVKSKYDAIVIGSGLGGATLTLKLAQEGLSVLVVERGQYQRFEKPQAGESIGAYLYHQPGHPPNSTDEPFGVGGQTKYYGAALYRFRESDFEAVAHEAGISPAWPITYSDLEPYYAEAERLYRVHGAIDGDPSEPPRSSPFPHPPLPHDPKVARVIHQLKSSGVETAAIPRGLDYGEGRPCVLCATCDVHACRIDAKMDAEVAALRPALATGNVDLLTGTDCLSVVLDDDGRKVTGVMLKQNGASRRIVAPVVTVSAGLKGTIELLRRSRTPKHPEGLGNQSGLLGRGLAGHTTGFLFALISAKSLGACHTKTFAINTHYGSSDAWPHPLGVVQAAGQIPLWEGTSRLKRPLVKFVAERSLMCFYMNEALPTRETGYAFDGDRISHETAPLTNARAFEQLGQLASQMFRRAGYPVISARRAPAIWHKTGGAIMGLDPSSSVTDRQCAVHGIQGLHVVDASVLPSAGAVNTGLTIAALALRAGGAIARGQT